MSQRRGSGTVGKSKVRQGRELNTTGEGGCLLGSLYPVICSDRDGAAPVAKFHVGPSAEGVLLQHEGEAQVVLNVAGVSLDHLEGGRGDAWVSAEGGYLLATCGGCGDGA